MTFNLFVPTRARPDNARRLLHSIAATAFHKASISVTFYVDDDDVATRQCAEELKATCCGLDVRLLMGPRIALSDTYNAMFAATEHGEILWSGGDDILFRTPGWDSIVAAAFAAQPDQILLVYGDDCLQHERLATHPFMSRVGVSVVGYFFPTIDGYSPTDIWTHRMYGAIGRLKYCPDVVTEHMHPFANKAEMDQTYQDQFDHNLLGVMACANRNYGATMRDAVKLRAYTELWKRRHKT